MNEPIKPRVMREISAEQDKILRVLESVQFGRVTDILYKDGKVRRIEVVYQFDFDHPETIKKTIDELKTIGLL